MKIFKVTHRRTHDENDGYSYHANKAAATREQHKSNTQYKKDGFEYNDEVDEIEFELTKKGIISLLNVVASHPDNG